MSYTRGLPAYLIASPASCTPATSATEKALFESAAEPALSCRQQEKPAAFTEQLLALPPKIEAPGASP